MQRAKIQDLHGIDVSRWQGEIDWKAVKGNKKGNTIQFAYIKASEGLTWIDPRFSINASQARAAGIAAGAYHFARPDLNPSLIDATKEAKHFIDTMQAGFGSDDFGDIYPVLDLEAPFPKDESVMTATRLLAWANAFRKYFERQTGIALMLYTGNYFINNYDNFNHPSPGNPLSNMPLWIARYTKQGKPEPPPNAGGWNRWTVWQYTDKGKVAGIAGNVDLNRAVPELIS